MKKTAIFWIFIFFLAAALAACDGGGGGCDNDEVDPCRETPNCIPDLSDWKLPYKPHHGDCMQCHTTCTPSSGHTFCATGAYWNVPESTCLKCHATQHQTRSTRKGVLR